MPHVMCALLCLFFLIRCTYLRKKRGTLQIVLWSLRKMTLIPQTLACIRGLVLNIRRNSKFKETMQVSGITTLPKRTGGILHLLNKQPPTKLRAVTQPRASDYEYQEMESCLGNLFCNFGCTSPNLLHEMKNSHEAKVVIKKKNNFF